MQNWFHRWFGAAAGGLLLAVLAGCASPGPPLPPSLKLPVVPTDLTAARAGDQVTLHWTTPERTTDKLLIQGSVTAEICRTEIRVTTTSGPVVAATPCGKVVVREAVTPGASVAVDALPVELLAGPPGVLAYRVRLLNAAGRTAGASAAVSVASGAAPGMVDGLRATATKRGVVLEWSKASGADENVELNRVWLNPAVQAAPAKASLLPSAKEPVDMWLWAGAAAGTVDATAQIGRSYSYRAQRVRKFEVNGQQMEMRSALSTAVTVKVEDVFPPEAPVGLVAAPEIVSPGTIVVAEGAKAGVAAEVAMAIALSWEPNTEPHVAGYHVYRREGDGVWSSLSGELVRVAAYRDATVAAGKTYAYRVTAVSNAGVESAPSAETVETAPVAAAAQ